MLLLHGWWKGGGGSECRGPSPKFPKAERVAAVQSSTTQTLTAYIRSTRAFKALDKNPHSGQNSEPI